MSIAGWVGPVTGYDQAVDHSRLQHPSRRKTDRRLLGQLGDILWAVMNHNGLELLGEVEATLGTCAA